MQKQQRQGVQRPLLYILAAVLTVAIVLPLANSSGQMQPGGLFDECFGDDCSGASRIASAD